MRRSVIRGCGDSAKTGGMPGPGVMSGFRVAYLSLGGLGLRGVVQCSRRGCMLI